MKKNKNRYIISLLSCCLLLCSSLHREKNFKIIEGDLHQNFNIIEVSGHWNESSIIIDGEAIGVDAHNWSWAANQPWCSGNGSVNNPYVLENITIDGQNLNNCIEINNSGVNFIIKNSTIFNSVDKGIKLYNTSKGIITNNIITDNNNRGVYLDYCYDINISSNFLENNTMSIYLGYSNNSEIFNNSIYNDDQHGIVLNHGSCDNNIYNNTIKFCPGNGMLVYRNCTHNVIDKNIFDKNYRGIWIYGNENNTYSNNYINPTTSFGIEDFCDKNIFINNTIINATIRIYGSFSKFIGNSLNNTIIQLYNTSLDGLSSLFFDNTNLIDGKPLYYYKHTKYLSTANFTNAGLVVLVNCSVSNITDVNISNCYDGISIYYSFQIKVADCNSSYNNKAFFIKECENITLIGNAAEQSGYGIYIQSSNSTIVDDNFLKDNYRGIQLETSIYSEISNNDIEGNKYDGICISNSNKNRVEENNIMNNVENGLKLTESNDNIIAENNIYSNMYEGIEIELSNDNVIVNNNIMENKGSGLKLIESNDNSISENYIYSNSESGISLYSSNNNNISENILTYNSQYGIYLDENSGNNYIYRNSFIGNNFGCIEDEGFNNLLIENLCDELSIDLWILIISISFAFFIASIVIIRKKTESMKIHYKMIREI